MVVVKYAHPKESVSQTEIVNTSILDLSQEVSLRLSRR